jgi:T5SS/PEP-CTERM-associated repeat protein/autotransporter-associated beta strand protein
VTVTGVFSTWFNTVFIVGALGSGTLTIENGGRVFSGSSSIGNVSGPQGPGVGTVTVTGGAEWNTSGGLTVGNQGIGMLTVSDGGLVTSSGGIIGNSGPQGAGQGTVTVTGATGAGSRWFIFGSLGIGNVGSTGTLTIADGGAVSNVEGIIGVGPGGSQGTVTVTGAGSTWTNSASVTVGGSIGGPTGGTGTLTIADGGTVSASTVIVANGAGSTGTLNIGAAPGSAPVAPGTLSTPTVLFGDGTGTLNFNHTATNYVFAPAISGTGSVNVLSGTTILTGTNTYSGGTTIAAGTLAVGADNNLGAAAGGLAFTGPGTLQFLSSFTTNRPVTLNATGTFDTQANTDTLAGVISGPGGLTKVGSGILALNAANTYTGPTAINAGTLQTGIANALSTATAVTVASGATFNLNSFNQSIGSLAGAGSVTLGSATLATGNDNTSTTFSGAISGSGGLTKIGSGIFVLTGSNTYSGPTTISAGTLTLGNGGSSGSIAGNVVNNGTFAINRSDTFTFGNVISGTGSFQQNGTGTTVLTGNNTYSGATAVNAGTLFVNGSIANSAVTVNSGATLAGIGTVGPTTINSGGIFAPGTSPGTITVQGNLAFQSGAFYLVQVNPSTASSTNVTAGGSASLAGTVNAAFAAGSYVSRTYTILSAAGGLNGTTFNALTTTNLPAGFTSSLSYTATDAILNLTATLGQPGAPGAPGAPGVPSGPNALGTGALSFNQFNVANSLNNFFNNGGALPPSFVGIFGLTGANLASGLSQLSGEAATGAQKVGFQLTDQFLTLMLDPFVDGRSGVGGADHPALGFAPEREELPEDIALAYAKILKAPPKPAPVYEPRWTVWGAGFGGSNRTTGDLAVIGSHDLSARTAGGAAGLDYRLTPDTVVGLALAGAGTDWSLSQGLGGGKSDAFQAGLYGATKSGPAYLAAAFAFTNHWMSTDRFAVGDHLTANFNAQSYGGRLEGGYRFATPYAGITPYAAIQAQNFHTPGYTETGLIPSGFALAFGSRDATDTRSELGARFDRVLAVYSNAVLALRGRVAWAHDWVSDPTLTPLFQTLPGASFIVNGALPVKDSALVSAGAELRLANGVTLLGKFDGEFAGRSNTYAGTGTIRYRW